MSGELAYGAYLEYWKSRRVYGRLWDELLPAQREAWAAAEEAIRERYEYPEGEIQRERGP